MQNCLGELILTYCLIYFDDVIVFLKMEQHLKHLCLVFNCFWEYNLRIKPTKCEFFQDEINYLAHHFSKKAMWPSKENLKAVAEFAPPQAYTEIQAFLGLVGHCGQLSRGLHILWNSYMSIHWEKVSIRRAIKWCSWQRSRTPLRLLRRLVLRLLWWLLLPLTSHFS